MTDHERGMNEIVGACISQFHDDADSFELLLAFADGRESGYLVSRKSAQRIAAEFANEFGEPSKPMTIETGLPAVKVEWSEPPLTCPHIDRAVDSGALPEEVISELDKIRDINSQLRYGTWYLSAELAAKETEALGYLRAVGTLQDRIAELDKALKHAYAILLSEGYEEDSAALHPIRSALSAYRKASDDLKEAEGLRDRCEKLEKAASAVIAQWDTPNWKLTEPTAKLIEEMRSLIQKQKEG